MERKTTRMTRQKEAIISLLGRSFQHPTAEEIHRDLLNILPKLSLATVYRNLRHLVRDGVILELAGTDSISRFDGRTGEHSHLICELCGSITDLPLPSLDTKTINIPAERISRIDLKFIGICEQCSKKGKTQK